MPAIATNNAKGTLSAGINSSANSLTLNSGQGALFPNPTGDQYFYVTLVDSSNATEIVKCTSRSGDTLTIVRAQDGTIPRVFSASNRVELRVVAAYLNEGNAPSGISTGKAIAMAMVFG
tara:strand:- start:42 stop:398 length:357 start_codon:yes stop_codon:yes gene_type:complete